VLRLQAQLPLQKSWLKSQHYLHKSTFRTFLNHRCHSLSKIRRLILTKTLLLTFKSRRPQCSFILNQRDGITSFFTVLFRTLDLTFLLTFVFHLCLISFLSTLVLFTCTYLHFTYSLSPFLILLSQKQTTPKKGRDITPDIFYIVLNRAFWRQNYNHF
jgi:hypothetical protein